ncbi:MAG: hypothetical protein GQ569_03895 [Methylococcaceae bacterium]|nr:hypothetical protein [Methylococcaceae bacterium]
MHCPTCKNIELKPIKLEGGLPAEGCPQCHGASVSLWVYREWLTRNPEVIVKQFETEPHAEIETVDVKNLLFCSKCSGVMSKYRISTEAENRLDLCIRCNETWLNHGEWNLIQALNLTDKLNHFFNDSWQNKIRETQNHQRTEEKWKALFADDYQEINRIIEWIKNHKHSDALLKYINKH